MFVFMLKKTFFDYWDNLFRMFFLNFGYIVVLSGTLGLSFLIYMIPFLAETVKAIICTLLIVEVFFIYSGAVHGMTREIADYQTPGFREFFKHLRESVAYSSIFGAAFSILVFVLLASFSIYNYMDIFFKDFARFFILFSLLIVFTACQYFFPILFGLDKRFFKIIKKMFLIFFDNPLFSLGIFIFSLAMTALSFVAVLMIPGLAAIPLLLNIGLKLRLYKYDYLEQNPEANRAKIPWDELLINDREKVGKRTLKGMIFPWKE